MKKFLDFLDDIIQQEDTNKDYFYILYLVIKNIISDKVEGIKYTNKSIQEKLQITSKSKIIKSNYFLNLRQ